MAQTLSNNPPSPVVPVPAIPAELTAQGKSVVKGQPFGLVVSLHPVKEFYKDEGGKSNWMNCALTLKGVSLPLEEPLRLNYKLFFESGKAVEEHDQKILRVRPNLNTADPASIAASGNADAATSSIKLDPATGEAVAQFRIEKVSRRKDNQKFTIRWSVEGHSDYGEVFTKPVIVFSKRKIPAALRGDPVAIARHKAMKRAKLKRARAAKREASTDAVLKRVKLSTECPTLHARESCENCHGADMSGLQTQIEAMARCLDSVYSMMQDQRVQMNRIQEQLWKLQSGSADVTGGLPMPLRGSKASTIVGKHAGLCVCPEPSPRSGNLWTGLSVLASTRADTPVQLCDTNSAPIDKMRFVSNPRMQELDLTSIDLCEPTSPFPTPAISPLNINL